MTSDESVIFHEKATKAINRYEALRTTLLAITSMTTTAALIIIISGQQTAEDTAVATKKSTETITKLIRDTSIVATYCANNPANNTLEKVKICVEKDLP